MASKNENDVKKCKCGCGVDVTPGRRYRQGHDAKHKSVLLQAALSGDDEMAKVLINKGWYTARQLKERRAMIAAKSARTQELAS